MLKERRAFPRYNMEFPVFVSVEEVDKSDVFSSVSVNISQTTIEVACDAELVEAIQAQEQFPASCILEFQIPNSDESLNITCQVKSHRRLSQHQFRLVVLLVEFNEGSIELLASFLNDPLNLDQVCFA